MKAPFSNLPALPAALGLTAGILLYAVGLGAWPAAACVVLFAVLYFTRHHYASFFFIMAAAGTLIAFANRPDLLPEDTGVERADCTATVSSVTVSSTSTTVIADISRIGSVEYRNLKCIITVSSPSDNIEPGDAIAFRAGLLPVQFNPSPVPFTSDYGDMLARQGIVAKAYVTPSEITILKKASGLRGIANTARKNLFNAIVDSPVDGATAGFLTAVLLSDSRFLDPSSIDAYRSTGIAHILALSGLHVGIIAMIIAFLLFPLNTLRSGYIMRSLLTLLLVWAYVAVVGGGASVVRAAVMISCMLAANLLQRKHRGWNSLCVAVTVILVAKPLWLFAPGFVMSVAAVASIMAFGSLVPTTLRRHPWRYRAVNTTLIPVAGMLGTGMAGACFFGNVPLMLLPANIVAGILFPIVLVSGIVLMAGTLCGLSLTWIGFLADFSFSCLESCASFLDGLCPALHVELSGWTALPYVAFLCSLLWAVKTRRRAACTVAAALLAVTAATAIATRTKAPRCEAYLAGRRGATEIIVRDGDNAWIRTIFSPRNNYRGAETDNLASASKAYAHFLRSRGCSEFESMPGVIDSPWCYADSTGMVVGAATVTVAGKNIRVPAEKAGYCLVTNEFTGNATDLAATADTLVLGADINSSRRKRIIRQCGDSIPWIDLRQRGVCIVP